MRITAVRLGIAESKYPDRWIGDRLAGIATRRQIDEARISIARFRDRSPACEVGIHLVTPGPDLAGRGVDHTVEAAFAKALAQNVSSLAGWAATRLRRQRQGDQARRDRSLSPS
jgi:hypothetical protein